MAQKLVAQTCAFRCAFNQTGNIGNHKALLRRDAHHAQIGVQGGERVVGNFGARIRHRRNKRRFSGVGHTEQTDIGQHLQLELQVFFVARPTGGFLARRAVDRALKTQVAKATIAAFGNGDDFAGFEQLVQHFAGFSIGDDGADGHFQRDVATGRAKHIGAHAVLAALGLVAARVAVVHQRVQVDVCHGKYVTTAAAIAAVGAAKFLVFFVPERHATIAAIPGGNVYIGFVNEFHQVSRLSNGGTPCTAQPAKKHKAPARRGNGVRRCYRRCAPEKTKPRPSGASGADKA